MLNALKYKHYFSIYYKKNAFLRRFLWNLFEKSISLLFIVEVVSRGRRQEVFVEVFLLVRL
jgi:hypothetical protein